MVTVGDTFYFDLTSGAVVNAVVNNEKESQQNTKKGLKEYRCHLVILPFNISLASI